MTLKTWHVLVPLALVGTGVFLYVRGQRVVTVTDPAHVSLASVGAVMTAGLKSLAPLGATTTTATPIDQSSETKPARTDLGADYTGPVISKRRLDLPVTHADFAVAGLYKF